MLSVQKVRQQIQRNWVVQSFCRHESVCSHLLAFFSLRTAKEFYFNDKFVTGESRFEKILIANRGDVACRVIATCRRLGIKTVAVYSVADAGSRFVHMADEAVCLGPAPVAMSYLSMDAIINAVKITGAQAVHPGYGFLSENSVFAKKLEDNGIAFLGPNSRVIRTMGDKIASKRIATKAGVNCIPGYDGVVNDLGEAVRIANTIGFPIMMKASAGGGGKGMRIAWDEKGIIEGYQLSRREAIANFGDNRMLLERFMDKSRHIEIQVLCDKYGNAIHLNERECSIQRRNQKIIEEAPSVFLDSNTRRAMCEQAVNLARAVGYDSVGTVEFLVDEKRNFYFIEMNTRLQVEHAVTECITGIDIVHQMIRIGKGHKLLYKQEDVPIDGWGIECRVYAEDPYIAFGQPSSGRLTSCIEPLHIDGVRCDSGTMEGSEISSFYDSMICKLITFGDNRQEALDTMIRALDSFVIRGVTSNIPLLRNILTEKRFISGSMTTSYLSETYPEGFRRNMLSKQEVSRLVAVGASVSVKAALRNRTLVPGDTGRFEQGPFNLVVNPPDFPPVKASIVIKHEAHTRKKFFEVTVSQWEVPRKIAGIKEGEEVAEANGQSISKPVVILVEDNFTLADHLIQQDFNGESTVLQLLSRDTTGNVSLQYLGSVFHLKIRSEKAASLEAAFILPKKAVDHSSVLTAPVPGLITSVSVKPGDLVNEGQEMCVLEAMKMQNSMVASRSGIVKAVNFKQGETVAVGDVIIELV